MQIMEEKIQKHFLEKSNIIFYSNIFLNMKCQIFTFFIYFLQRKPLTFRSKTIVQQSIEPSTRTTSTSAPSLWSRASPPGVSCMSSSDILFIFHIFILKKGMLSSLRFQRRSDRNQCRACSRQFTIFFRKIVCPKR